MEVFLEWVVTPQQAGMTAGHLARRQYHLSSTLYRRLKARGGLWLNGRPVPAYRPVAAGDRLQLALPADPPAVPQPLPLKVIFEDAHLLVVHKPAGMVMHPARGHPAGTLVNAVVHHRLARGEPPWVHPVHRLDKDVSGLVLIAKNPYVHEHLLRRRSFGRSYVAVVHGHVKPSGGVVDAPILDPPAPATSSTGGGDPGLSGLPLPSPARLASPLGRPATTRFRVVRRTYHLGHPVTVLLLRLQSGRTHQIRLHMALIGHPVWGDPVYGGDPAGQAGQGLLLHAARLWLAHPVTGQRLVFRSRPGFLGP